MVESLTVMEYLPVGLALVGLALVLSGLQALRPLRTARSWPAWARTYLRFFRGVVVGACLIGAAWGWSAHIDWLVAASVCLAIGEFLESSYYVLVLEWGARSARLPSE
jgi:hypothetical protein